MPRGVYKRQAPSQEGMRDQNPEVAEQAVSPRAAEMRRERRRRNDGDLDRMGAMKLAIPQEVREQGLREGKVFRWTYEHSMPAAEADDWDRVDGVAPVQANPGLGTDERLVLCAKYRDWHEADRLLDEKTIDQFEETLLQGQVPGTSDDGATSQGLHVPRGQVNRISRQQGL